MKNGTNKIKMTKMKKQLITDKTNTSTKNIVILRISFNFGIIHILLRLIRILRNNKGGLKLL